MDARVVPLTDAIMSTFPLMCKSIQQQKDILTVMDMNHDSSNADHIDAHILQGNWNVCHILPKTQPMDVPIIDPSEENMYDRLAFCKFTTILDNQCFSRRFRENNCAYENESSENLQKLNTKVKDACLTKNCIRL